VNRDVCSQVLRVDDTDVRSRLEVARRDLSPLPTAVRHESLPMGDASPAAIRPQVGVPPAIRRSLSLDWYEGAEG
jgi:hypothetical protein